MFKILHIIICNLYQVTYLGLVWNLKEWAVALTSKREEKIRCQADVLLTSDMVKCRQVARFLGSAIASQPAVPLARGRCRVVQWLFLASCRSPDQFDDHMTISEDAREELKFWANLPTGISLPISVEASGQSLDTDAAPGRVGYYFNGQLVSEKVPNQDISALEILALEKALISLGDSIKPGRLTWRVDNTAAMYAIRKQGSTRSWNLSCLATRILERALRMGVVLEPVRVSSEENLLADCASRNKKVQDWSLNQKVVDKIFRRFGKADVDLMASDLSRKAPFFYSWSRQDKQALALDALATDVDWTQWENPYCFPPFSLILPVLRKILEQRVPRLMLVLPWREGQSYMPMLQVRLCSQDFYLINNGCQDMVLEVVRLRKIKEMLINLTSDEQPDYHKIPLVACIVTGQLEVSSWVWLPLLTVHVLGDVSEAAQRLIQASWRGNTEKQYKGCWKTWLKYCGVNGISELSPSISEVLEFLTSCYERGMSYSYVNTYRSALSSTLPPIDGVQVGKHPLVIRLLKGVFNLRAPIKNVSPPWSVQKVLHLLRQWSPINKLSLKDLSFKTLMLLALATARRCSSLSMLTIKEDFCHIGESRLVFQPVGLEKESRPDHIAPPIQVEEFHDLELDPVACVKEYLKRTKPLRQTDSLFVTLMSPHKAASTSCLASWIVKVIEQSGQKGSGGSVRSMSTSKAIAQGASIESVLEAGDWVRESTFRRFYYKPNPLSFASAVLS